MLYSHAPVDGIAADRLYTAAMTEAMNAPFREALLIDRWRLPPDVEA